jgi:hypothetical protein
MKNKISENDVADFMKTQLDKKKYLSQEEIVYEIEKIFGPDFVYTNENGNQAIKPKVLSAFRKITPNVVWESGERCWRLREDYDEAKSRLQD